MNKNIAFLFDLDGVLIDSEETYTCIWNAINEKFPTGVKDFAHKIKGSTLNEIITDYFHPSDRTAITEMLYDLEGKMRYGFMPGAHELLESLQKLNIKDAIVTSSDDKKMEHLHEDLPEIFGMVDLIITGDSISRSKPDPEGYLLAAERLEVAPRSCVVFEDSLQGVKAGHESGAYVVGLAGTLPADIISPYCDTVINSLTEIQVSKLIKILAHR